MQVSPQFLTGWVLQGEQSSRMSLGSSPFFLWSGPPLTSCFPLSCALALIFWIYQWWAHVENPKHSVLCLPRFSCSASYPWKWTTLSCYLYSSLLTGVSRASTKSSWLINESPVCQNKEPRPGVPLLLTPIIHPTGKVPNPAKALLRGAVVHLTLGQL